MHVFGVNRGNIKISKWYHIVMWADTKSRPGCNTSPEEGSPRLLQWCCTVFSYPRIPLSYGFHPRWPTLPSANNFHWLQPAFQFCECLEPWLRIEAPRSASWNPSATVTTPSPQQELSPLKVTSKEISVLLGNKEVILRGLQSFLLLCLWFRVALHCPSASSLPSPATFTLFGKSGFNEESW